MNSHSGISSKKRYFFVVHYALKKLATMVMQFYVTYV